MLIKLFLILSIISTALFSQIKSGSYVLNLQNNAKDVLGFDTDAWLPDTMPVAIGNTIKIYNRNCYFEKNQRYGRVAPDWVTATGAAWLVNYDSWDSPNPASLNTWDNYQIKMRALWKITHDLYQGGRKYANIQISYEGLCLDRINMFEVNDTMHPKDAGYYQYGYILSNSLNYYKK